MSDKLTCPKCGASFKNDPNKPTFECPVCHTDIMIDRGAMLDEIEELIKNKEWEKIKGKTQALYQYTDSNVIDVLNYSADVMKKQSEHARKEYRGVLLTTLIIFGVLTAAFFGLNAIIADAQAKGIINIVIIALFGLSLVGIGVRTWWKNRDEVKKIKQARKEIESSLSVLRQTFKLTING